jgi:hypothetical protein
MSQVGEAGYGQYQALAVDLHVLPKKWAALDVAVDVVVA